MAVQWPCRSGPLTAYCTRSTLHFRADFTSPAPDTGPAHCRPDRGSAPLSPAHRLRSVEQSRRRRQEPCHGRGHAVHHDVDHQSGRRRRRPSSTQAPLTSPTPSSNAVAPSPRVRMLQPKACLIELCRARNIRGGYFDVADFSVTDRWRHLVRSCRKPILRFCPFDILPSSPLRAASARRRCSIPASAVR